MRLANLTARVVVLRRSQCSNDVVEEISVKTSNRELDAGTHDRRSLHVRMEPGILGHQLQHNEPAVRWFDSPVDQRWRDSRKALGYSRGGGQLKSNISRPQW